LPAASSASRRARPRSSADTAPAVLRVVLFDLSIALLLVLVIVVLSILK
jgi:hypothetical protein